MSPTARIRFGWGLLIASLVGYPLTALTVARREPQIVLLLSFMAIWLTALDYIEIAKTRKEQKESP